MSAYTTPLQPEAPFFAVGDVHGRYDLLVDLLRRIDPDQDQQIIFLGDYVDRGPDTARVLAFLFELNQSSPDRTVCLMGNHERMMCEFLDDPLGRGARWLDNGGIDTLASYGITGIKARGAEPAHVMEVCDTLKNTLPAGLGTWLRRLPLSWNSGNMWCVHAAMDPAKTPAAQRANVLLWGHRDFFDIPRDDGICVVHGHTVVSAPENHGDRIAVDTGACDTGHLTAAHITDGACTFVMT